MKKEFVMRGQTASGQQEVLNFSGITDGYAYRLTEFQIYPGTNIGLSSAQFTGTITAGKTAVTPTEPNFNNEALIGCALHQFASALDGDSNMSVVNDTFLITQNLILMVQDTQSNPVNWQCRFVSVKMTGPEEATANYKQFAISDEQ